MSISTNQQVHTNLHQGDHKANNGLEDSFVLLDALEQDQDVLRSSRPSICLEVGWVSSHSSLSYS